MLGAGGTCEFKAPTECRRPAFTSVTGFCACLRPTARPSRDGQPNLRGGWSSGLPMPESRAMGASEARMAKRSGHAESRGPEGRGERPATGMGSPERRGDPRSPSLTRLGFLARANVRRRGMGSPERRGTQGCTLSLPTSGKDSLVSPTPLRTPLAAWHESHGGRMVDFAGWWMPVQYSSIVEEHLATPPGDRTVRRLAHGPARDRGAGRPRLARVAPHPAACRTSPSARRDTRS
jgi:hypothetical protein